MFAIESNKRLSVRQKIAILFVGLFFSTILLKPLHFLFVDHNEEHPISATAATGSNSTASHEHDCNICQFNFQYFTTHQFAEITHYIRTHFLKIEVYEVLAYFSQQATYISLRAPPAILFN
ncbi:MAG: hypothetical protein ACK5MK_06075 [Dysgonomonas sp.]